MPEAIPFIGPLVSGVGSLIGGNTAASGARDAANIQAAASDRALLANEKARQENRLDTSYTRDYQASATRRLAEQLGFPTGDYTDTASGFGLPGLPAGASRDPYEDPNQRSYPEIVAPYLSQLTPIRQNSESLMRMFSAPPDEGGQPAWYRNALAGYKQSPGYEFARNEAERQFNQSAGGNIMGGGRLREGERLASGYAAQDYGGFRDSVINAIMGGAKLGMGATQQSADLLNSALNTDVGSFQNQDKRYTDFFNRLLQSAGLNSATTAAGIQAGTTLAGNSAQLIQNEGTAQARGITGAANATAQSYTNALAPFATPSFTSNLQDLFGSSNFKNVDAGGTGEGFGNSTGYFN